MLLRLEITTLKCESSHSAYNDMKEEQKSKIYLYMCCIFMAS